MTNSLLDPVKLGALDLRNRIFMAPLTRARSGAQGIPGELVAEYYRQRATAGLIIGEATAVARRGHAWPGAPGVYTDAQQAGWRQVTDAVHAEGGRMFLQLFHMGWASLPDHIEGQLPLAPSAVTAQGEIPNKDGVPTPFPTSVEMTLDDIAEARQAFVDAAKRSIAAGMDGVEIHAANSFLIDEFLRDGTNKRTDHYGGSIENRARFLLEVVDETIAAIGADKTAVRISPTNAVFGIADSDPKALFTHVARELSTRDLAYLHVLEPANDSGSFMATEVPAVAADVRAAYDGFLILNGGLDAASGAAAIDAGKADAIAFGSLYISNPDLVERIAGGLDLTPPNPDTFYTPGPEGYTDYPAANPVPAQ